MDCKTCGYLEYSFDPDFGYEREHCTYPLNSTLYAPCECGDPDDVEEPTYEDYYHEMVESRGNNWW